MGVTSRMVVMVMPAACRARSADSRPGTGPRDVDFQGAHAVLGGLLAGVLGGHLGGVGRRLARTLEAHGAGAGPGDGVPLGVGDGDHGVVERGVHVRHARGDVLALAFLTRAGSLAIDRLSYFFLPAIGLAGPLRVRALVWVRWPRTGRPLR